MCLHCGTQLSLELGFSAFCSASCVWEGERLRKRTEEGLAALRAEVEQRAATRGRRRSFFGRLRGDIELDEDAATVVAMSAAGATVLQIARYTALEPGDVERLLGGDHGGPAARAEARARARGRLATAEPRPEADAADIAQAS
jgi:hypothetical protein